MSTLAPLFKKHPDCVKAKWSPLQWHGREQLRVKVGDSGKLHVQIVTQSTLGWLASHILKFLTCGASKSLGKHVTSQATKTMDATLIKGGLTAPQIAYLSKIQKAKLHTALKELENTINSRITALVKQMVSFKSNSADASDVHILLEQAISAGKWLDAHPLDTANFSDLQTILLQGRQRFEEAKFLPSSCSPSPVHPEISAHEASSYAVSIIDNVDTGSLEQVSHAHQHRWASLKKTASSLPEAPLTSKLAHAFLETWMSAAVPSSRPAHPQERHLQEQTSIQAASTMQAALDQMAFLAAFEIRGHETVQLCKAKAASLKAEGQIVQARLLQEKSHLFAQNLTASLAFPLEINDPAAHVKKLQKQLTPQLNQLNASCLQADKHVALLDQLALPEATPADKREISRLILANAARMIDQHLAFLDSEQTAAAVFLSSAKSKTWQDRVASCFEEKKFNLRQLLPPADSMPDETLAAYWQSVEQEIKTAIPDIEKATAYKQALSSQTAWKHTVENLHTICQTWSAQGHFLNVHHLNLSIEDHFTAVQESIKMLSSKEDMVAFASKTEESRQALESDYAALQNKPPYDFIAQLQELKKLNSMWYMPLRNQLTKSTASLIDSTCSLLTEASSPNTQLIASLQRLKKLYTPKSGWFFASTPLAIADLTPGQFISYIFETKRLCENSTQT